MAKTTGSAAPYETVRLDVCDGVAVLTLNRPEVLNSLNQRLLEEARSAVAVVASDPGARVLVITGEGRGFCAGADLTGLGGSESEEEARLGAGDLVARKMDALHNPLIRAIHALEKPVVSAVNGVAAGGGVGLALSADLVIAARSAVFVQVFGPKLGIVPDMGCTWHLPRLVGRARALGLAFLGDRLPAETAAEWGLIWKCVEDPALMDEALGVARKLAEGPTRAFGYIRRAITAAGQHTLAQQLDVERESQRVLCGTADFQEGVAAFLEKRPPRFQGK